LEVRAALIVWAAGVRAAVIVCGEPIWAARI
jgi:hypothetical protein